MKTIEKGKQNQKNLNLLRMFRTEQGLEILPDVKFNQQSLETELSSADEGIAEVLILSNSRLIGTTLRELKFRQRYNLTVLAIRREKS